MRKAFFINEPGIVPPNYFDMIIQPVHDITPEEITEWKRWRNMVVINSTANSFYERLNAFPRRHETRFSQADIMENIEQRIDVYNSKLPILPGILFNPSENYFSKNRAFILHGGGIETTRTVSRREALIFEQWKNKTDEKSL